MRQVKEMFFRGDRPHVFVDLPIPASSLSAAYITFQQLGQTIIEKALEEMYEDDQTVYAILTPEETLRLNHRLEVSVQFRGKDASGNPLTSHVWKGHVGEILKEGEI